MPEHKDPYQFLTKNLHDMGYGMPLNIPVSDIQDYKKSRALAGQYVTGFGQKSLALRRRLSSSLLTQPALSSLRTG